MNLTGEIVGRGGCINFTDRNRTLRACSGCGIVTIQRVVAVVVRFSHATATQCNIFFINSNGIDTQCDCFNAQCVGSLTDGYGVVTAGFGKCTDGNRRFFFCQCGFTDGYGIVGAAFCGFTDGNGGGDAQFLGIRTHTCFSTDGDVVRTDHKCARTQAKSDVVHAGGVVARAFTDGNLSFVVIGVATAVCADIDGVRTDCASCRNGGVVHARVRTYHDIARTCRYGFVTDGDGVVGGGLAVLTERSRSFFGGNGFLTDRDAAQTGCLSRKTDGNRAFGRSSGLRTDCQGVFCICIAVYTKSCGAQTVCRAAFTDGSSIVIDCLSTIADSG